MKRKASEAPDSEAPDDAKRGTKISQSGETEPPPCTPLTELNKFLTGKDSGSLQDYVWRCIHGEQLPDYHILPKDYDLEYPPEREGTVSLTMICKAVQEVTLRVAYLYHRLLPNGRRRDSNHSLRNAQLYNYICVAGYAHLLPRDVKNECLRNKSFVEKAEEIRSRGMFSAWCQQWSDPMWGMQQMQQMQLGMASRTASRTVICYDDL